MGQVAVRTHSVDATALRARCAQLLVANGLSADDASLVADSLVEANLRGIDSHGVARLPHYLRRISAGSISPQPKLVVERLGPAVGRLDGDNGLGQIIMSRATDEAIALARQAGAGWVAVKNSSHCGALAYFGLRIARAGMVGFVFSHVDSMVLPHGAAEPFCGTNPICIAAPGENGCDLCLDMATSVTPWNSVTNAAIEGVPIPEGWAVDADGQDTTDPCQAAALFPIGGYKGSGLGIAIDVLCAMLSASPLGPDIPKMYGDLSQRRRLGGLVGAIDITRFVPLDQFHARLVDMFDRLGALPQRSPGTRVLFPGEPELLMRRQREASGIPVGLNVLQELDGLAKLHGLDPPLRHAPPPPHLDRVRQGSIRAPLHNQT